MKEEIILKLLERLLLNDSKIEISNESESVFIWKYVLLRWGNAWVHFGKLEYACNGVYRLSESRRLYRWRIKNKNWISLSELATYWLEKEYSKICIPIKLIEITEREWGEIIPVEESIIEDFKNFIVYKPN